MRFTKLTIVLGYVLFAIAIAFYAGAWLMADTAQATCYIAHGCFMLLLSIWANVCS